MKTRALLSLLLAALASSASVGAQSMPRESVIEFPAVGDGLSVHNLFQSNMVLQRDKPIALWGWAEPGEKVTVSFGNQSQAATAGDNRLWKVTFPAMPASAEPSSVTVKGAKASLTLDNILIGDVWILGGQSNMEFPLSKVENGSLEIISANFPAIRILTVPAQNGPEMKKGFPRLHEWSSWSGRHFRKGDWDVCTPEIAKELSAIGYVFARRLHMASGVPIGVIDASRGGTTVETWTPEPVLKKMDAPEVKSLLTRWDEKLAAWDPKADLEKRIQRHQQKVEKLKAEGKEVKEPEPSDLKPGPINDQNKPGNCYASMISPLAGLSVKGAIFHQGYNNCFSGSEGARMYRHVFPKMITAWRAAFNDPEMPFGILTLCTAGDEQTLDNYTSLMSDVGALIRAAQYETFLEFYQAGDENIGFTSTYDLRRRWYHPQLKVPAGERIARWALATEYGFEKEIKWKPPMIEEMKVEDGRILLHMDGSASNVDNGGVIEGFAIAGENREFHPATAAHLVTGKDDRGRAKKDNKVIVLTSPMVPKPIHFRYAWARNPMGNLQAPSNSDIPFATQRSDDWSVEEVPLSVAAEVTPDFNERAHRGKVQKALRELDLKRKLHEAKALLEASKEN